MSVRRWVVVVVIALVAVACSGGGGETINAGEISFAKLDGNGDGSTAEYGGRPLVVNFFGSWCVPCVSEMPALERVHQAFGDRVAFLGLSVNDPVEESLALVERTGVTWDIGRDPQGDILRRLGGVGMPTTVLIDPDGDVVESHTGELTEQELTDKIEEHFF